MQIASPELIDPASRAFKSVLDQLAPTDATARCGVNQLRAGNLHLIHQVNWKAMTIPRG